MPTNKQRREAAKRHLERQLQHRQEREARRKRITMITSIAGSIVVVAAVVVAVVLIGGSDSDTSPAASSQSPSPTSQAPASQAPASTASTPPATPVPKATGPAVTFHGVTVKGAKDLKGEPTIKSAGKKAPTKLEYTDLVVGTGKTAAPKDKATVQYVGALYKNGQVFDASWEHPGQPAPSFTLDTGPQGVIEGFATGIGGGDGIPAMKVGGRRLLIIPSDMGYGKTGSGTIPPNSALVFVVDLKKLG